MPIYTEVTAQVQQEVQALPPASMSVRFVSALSLALEHLEAHRDELADHFAHALRHKESPVFSPDDPMRQALGRVITYATDTVKPDEIEDMTNLLYAFYGMVVLFWLYDRTPETRATRALVDFMGDMIKILRPMMMMPLFSKALIKVSGIMNLVFKQTP